MSWVHRALLAGAWLAIAAACLFAAGLLRKRGGGRAAAISGTAALAFLLADALGRGPVVLRTGEAEGTLVWSALDVSLRGGLPVLLWSLALLGRWRGWLAEVVFAWSVLIAAAVTLAVWLLPL